MQSKIQFIATLLVSTFLLCACSSSGKKDDAPAARQNPEEETNRNPPADAGTASKPTADGANSKMFSQEKTKNNFKTTTNTVAAINTETPNVEVQKILNTHFLAIECGVHVFGDEWDDRSREILRSELSTDEKLDGYVRAQMRYESKVITLHSLRDLDNLCK